MRHFICRIGRLVYAFSKSPAHHAAAVALAYTYYNLCWIPRTLRVTPAMAIGVTAHPWDLPELLDALLTVKPCEAPKKQPLAPRKPETTARELPNGRGFLRAAPRRRPRGPPRPRPPRRRPLSSASKPSVRGRPRGSSAPWAPTEPMALAPGATPQSVAWVCVGDLARRFGRRVNARSPPSLGRAAPGRRRVRGGIGPHRRGHRRSHARASREIQPPRGAARARARRQS